MRRLAITIALCAGCWTVAGAQATFTEQLQQSKSGEGKVTITQDKAIDDLINNAAATTPAPVPTAKPQQTAKPGDSKSGADRKDVDNLTDAAQTDLYHCLIMALRANALMHLDRDYIVRDGEVQRRGGACGQDRFAEGERLGDARGAHFGFMVDNDWYGDGDNDFDSFYPWSEMRLCNISVHDGMREFIY